MGLLNAPEGEKDSELNQWDGNQRHERYHVSVGAEHVSAFDVDPSGEYALLEHCGGALGSLHKRVSGDGPPLYFFLDPSRTGDPKFDGFVFAPTFGRVGYGEVRRTVGDLDPSWRPWAISPAKMPPQQQTIGCTVRGLWREAAGSKTVKLTPARFDGASVSAPIAAPALSLDAEARAPPAVALMGCKVPLQPAEAESWPEGEWGSIPLTRSKASP